MVTPDPPSPFTALPEVVPEGLTVYRCHHQKYRPGEFNPGPHGSGRFHFIGSPYVPALYFADTRAAALCERILRYTPSGHPSRLAPANYRASLISELKIGRELKMAQFHSQGLRALDVLPAQLTDTTSDNYPQTRKWAEAAYDQGFDGISWMSHQLNGCRSWMVFGDRVTEADLEVKEALPLGAGVGFKWLVDECATMNVEVMPPVGA